MVHGDDSDDGGDNNTSSGDFASLSDFASNVWHQQVVLTFWLLYICYLYIDFLMTSESYSWEDRHDAPK